MEHHHPRIGKARRLHRLALGLAAMAALMAPGTGVAGDDIAAARAAVKAFAGALKGELTAALAAGGPEHAIAVCHDRAPAIAAEIGARTGFRLGRTALRLRNPANAPTPWQRRVLDDFARRAAAGAPIATLEHSAVGLGKDGRREFRYMKAIPTGGLCLTCHGADVDPDLAARIRALYPRDRAIGFAEGSLRGAFIAVRPL